MAETKWASQIAARKDCSSPIRLARRRNVTVGEVPRWWQQSRILWTFATKSEITMDNESMLKSRKVITCVGLRKDFLRFIVKPSDQTRAIKSDFQ